MVNRWTSGRSAIAGALVTVLMLLGAGLWGWQMWAGSQAPPPHVRVPGEPPRVGIQAGHWESYKLPNELAFLRTSTGTSAAGHTEAGVSLDIARRVAAILGRRGVRVDLLSATVPPHYDADAFVALHLDGSRKAAPRGFKLATAWVATPDSQRLLEAITAEYGAATRLPWHDVITENMRGYYAFNHGRYKHAVRETTPAVIVEMGFLTNATDRDLITRRPDVVAQGIADGVLRYLDGRYPGWDEGQRISG